METLAERITLPQAKEALVRSGYILESRLETLLRNRGYYVEANSAYPDSGTGKSRELDLFAINGYKAGPRDLDHVFVVLLIECINNPQPIAFLTKDPLVSFLHRYAVKHAGLPVKIPDKHASGTWESLPVYLGMEGYHHYCKGRVATQFCSFSRKKNSQEWMASHDESHFDCFRKLSAAVEYFVDKQFKSWGPGKSEPVNVEFYYPIVVVQGGLLDVRPRKRALSVAKATHIQFRHFEYFRSEEQEYQIDIVSETYFSKYLDLIYQEMSKTARLLRRRHGDVRKAIDRIVKNARGLKSPDKLRAAMEF